MLKIKCKEKRTVGKANEEIKVEKYCFKKLKIKIIEKKKNGRRQKKVKKSKGKPHRIAKAQCRFRGL